LADWQIGRLADWQIGRLADWQIGRLAQLTMSRETKKAPEHDILRLGLPDFNLT
jgi:hypothetical protein